MKLKSWFGAMAALAVAIAPAWGAESAVDESAARAMYERLISFKTAKGRGEVPAMAAYLADEFRAAGFAADDIEISPVDETAALIVRYAGDGSSGKAPVLFLGHMDVVEALDGDWDFDPWTLVEKDGALYGRGTVDNKYGILTVSLAFIALKREGFVPKRDLVIAFSGDEETDMKTTRLLADRLKDAEFALNSDAGNGFYPANGGEAVYYLQAAEKTYATYEVTAKNEGGHSSQPRTDNAIYELADALKRIEAHEFPVMWNELTLREMAANSLVEEGALAANLRRFSEKPEDKKAQKYLLNVDWAANSVRTTCVATMLKAGHAENALPQTATATVNCRIFPGVSAEEVRTELARIVENPALEIRTLDEPVESPASIPTPEIEAAVLAAARVGGPVRMMIPYMEAGGTDGLWFRRNGVPTFGTGPIFAGENDNLGYHGKHEHIPMEAFRRGLSFFPALMREIGGDAATE